MIAVESAFDPNAVSPKGAVGLMQIMPETGARYGLVEARGRSIAQQLVDPTINLRIGTRYLRDLLALFEQDLTLALAAYNAGETRCANMEIACLLIRRPENTWRWCSSFKCSTCRLRQHRSSRSARDSCSRRAPRRTPAAKDRLEGDCALSSDARSGVESDGCPRRWLVCGGRVAAACSSNEQRENRHGGHDIGGSRSQARSALGDDLGVVMIIAGVLAVFAPGPAALAATLFFGAMFIVGGAAEIAHAFATRSEQGFGWKLLSGVSMLALGILFAVFPVAGIATLALIVGALLFAHGIASGMLAFKLKPRKGGAGSCSTRSSRSSWRS